MNPRESFINEVKYWKGSVKYWKAKYNENEEILKNDNLPEGKRKCYEGLRVVYKNQLKDSESCLTQLLSRGEIEHKEETPEEKTLFKKLYKQWKETL